MLQEYVQFASLTMTTVPRDDPTYRYQHLFAVCDILDNLTDCPSLNKLSTHCQMADYALYNFYKTPEVSVFMTDDLRVNMHTLREQVDAQHITFYDNCVQILTQHYQEALVN